MFFIVFHMVSDDFYHFSSFKNKKKLQNFENFDEFLKILDIFSKTWSSERCKSVQILEILKNAEK